MATLTLIADPFPDWEATAQAAAVRDLTEAVAETAPRSCSARYLIAKGAEKPRFQSPRVSVDQLPLRANMLPFVWQNGATARPLDGEFVHSLTPMIPLRSRSDDDGSQTSVTIPHAVAWEHPGLLGGPQARLFRTFTRRAIKLADVVFTPTHATARVLHEHYGEHLPVQVLPLAPPAEYLAGADAAERRTALGLPEHYAVTTATTGEHGRLEWLFDALQMDPSLPPLVVLEGLAPRAGGKDSREDGEGQQPPVPEALRERVVFARPRDLSDIGAVIAGASLLLQPQAYSGTGYTVLAALHAGVPVLHASRCSTAELVLDAGVSADASGPFAAEYTRLFRDTEALAQLSVLACDRGRGFTWASTAWQLWETHANL